MRSIRSLSIVVLALSIATTARAQTNPAADSVRHLVQRFYDWYLPQFRQLRGQDVMMKAATHGPLPFDAELVRWLRIDSTARARAKDEIDGLDGDPVLNAQDPCDAYTAQSVSPRGAAFVVDVLGHGGCAAHKKADVAVELALRNGRWTVVEFHDPSRRNEGLIPLLKRLHPKAK